MSKEQGLAKFLLVFGLGNILVHPILPWFFQQQFFWTPKNVPYEFMIGGLYIAWGIVMVVASRDPLKHKLFVDFTILGNLFHAIVMIFFGVMEQPKHLYGDVIWISALGVIPLIFYPWGVKNFLRQK
ncbi:MAG: DUF6632 domain-containing protein [Candidatus Spechtbacterales bacterium]